MKILISKKVDMPDFPCYMEDENGIVYFVVARLGSLKLEAFPITRNPLTNELRYGEFTSNLSSSAVHVFRGIITFEQ